MSGIALLIIPLLAGLAAFVIRHDGIRRTLIIGCSGSHLVLTCLIRVRGPQPFLNGWFALDPVGMIFLIITSVLFFGAAVYGIRYLSDEQNAAHDDAGSERGWFSGEAVFTGCLLLFLFTMTVVILSQHIAVLWVGIEATTLASAPLIYFHRTKRSLEATWKYLLICSVGIALALLGIFFLAVAHRGSSGEMLLKQMLADAPRLNLPWLKAAFLLIFVGYGTKMGLAPFHTWLPDAHSEAPSVVSALLSGALLNCAFLGILRGYQICVAAGLQAYCQEVFLVFGLLSVFFAAVFILGQSDYKRMLAYSSVEHMGIITLGVGLGGSAVLGAMINLLGHSLTKAGLFFIAGNLLSYYRTKNIASINGLLAGKMRWSGAFWLMGFLLITGTPPSGIFLGKFLILKEALAQGHYWITFIFLAGLAVVFVGMARIFIAMSQGLAKEGDDHAARVPDFCHRLVPSVVFFLAVIVLGLYIPAWLTSVLTAAAQELGGVL